MDEQNESANSGSNSAVINVPPIKEPAGDDSW